MGTMITKKQKQFSSAVSERGAVLLIAILIASISLAVGMGVYNRTYKELLFASFWKQTQIAFSAADSGLECALYWDLSLPVPATFSCFGNSSAAWSPVAGVWEVFGVNGTAVGGGCVRVTITKPAPASSAASTLIEARGYNTCDATSPRRVERGLQVTY